MASPASLLGASAAPDARIASSTCWASSWNWSSSTGRPWQARRTPATTLLRLKGSTTPLRLTTASTASSTVVNRRLHAGHERRRRGGAPSAASRGAGRADRVLHLLGEQLELVLVDRSALAGPADAGDDLAAVEGLDHPAALDDGEHGLLDRGEPSVARRARAAAARGGALVGLARRRTRGSRPPPAGRAAGTGPRRPVGPGRPGGRRRRPCCG